MVRECCGEACGHGENWGIIEKSLGKLEDGWGGLGRVGECSESLREAQGSLGVCSINVWLM